MFKTNQLIIVGGPSAVGKSTLLQSMQDGNNTSLCGQISVVHPTSYCYLSVKDLRKVRQSFINRLILHYDFLHHYSPKDGFAYLSDLINKSDNVCALTLCVPSRILFQRISLRIDRVQNSWRHNKRKIDRLQRIKEMYKSSSELMKAYERWSAYIEECGVVKHLITESSSVNQVASPYNQDEVRKILTNTLVG